jgi:hypothetical protein
MAKRPLDRQWHEQHQLGNKPLFLVQIQFAVRRKLKLNRG